MLVRKLVEILFIHFAAVGFYWWLLLEVFSVIGWLVNSVMTVGYKVNEVRKLLWIRKLAKRYLSV